MTSEFHTTFDFHINPGFLREEVTDGAIGVHQPPGTVKLFEDAPEDDLAAALNMIFEDETHPIHDALDQVVYTAIEMLTKRVENVSFIAGTDYEDVLFAEEGSAGSTKMLVEWLLQISQENPDSITEQVKLTSLIRSDAELRKFSTADSKSYWLQIDRQQKFYALYRELED